jgi:chromosome segregation ATPase
MMAAMNTLARSYAEKLSLWPFVGPFMLLCSLTLLFFNFPEKGLTFSFVVLLSLALCWQWTWRGVALSLGLTMAAFAYHAAEMSGGELLWHVGMSVALSLGFVATALTALEMQEEEEAPPSEVQQAVRETIKRLEEQLQTEREAHSQQKSQAIGLQQLLEEAREEIKTLMQEQEEDLRQLTSRSQAAAQAQERMIETRQQIEELKSQLEQEKSEERLQKMVQSEAEKWAQELRASRTQAEGQMRRAAFLEEEKQALRAQWERELQEKQTLEAHLALVQQNVAVAEAQKAAHWRSLRSVEGKYQQLKQQFEEKTLSLAEARRERFEAEERADKWRRELEELQNYGRLVEEKPLMKHLQKMERHYEAELQICQKESEALHSLISRLLSISR